MPSSLACCLLMRWVGSYSTQLQQPWKLGSMTGSKKPCLSGSSAWTLPSSRSRTIVDTGLAVKAAETKQIDNFQLNLNKVSTEPTNPHCPTEETQLRFPGSFGPAASVLTTSLVLCGVVLLLFSPDVSRDCRTSTPTTRQGYIRGHQVTCDELPCHRRSSQKAEKHAPTDDIHIDERAAVPCAGAPVLSHRTAAPLEMG